MPVRYPCGVCKQPVAKNHKGIQCDFCNLSIQIKCKSISPSSYENYLEDVSSWTCIECVKGALPFSSLSN